MGPYDNMDGLEPAAGMLELARQKKLYKNTTCQYVYSGCGLGNGKTVL